MIELSYKVSVRLQSAIAYLSLLAALTILGGCTTNKTMYSQRLEPNTAPTKTFDVVYVERNLISEKPINPFQGKGVPSDPTIVKYGYFETGPQLATHGPVLFKANGLDGEFRSIPSVDFDRAVGKTIGTSKERNTLVMDFRHGRLLRQGGSMTVSLLLSATLYANGSEKRLWTGQFRSHLGNDPALGVLLTTTVNQDYVEGLLAMVIDQMAKDGAVILPAEHTVIPSQIAKK